MHSSGGTSDLLKNVQITSQYSFSRFSLRHQTIPYFVLDAVANAEHFKLPRFCGFETCADRIYACMSIYRHALYIDSEIMGEFKQ